MSSFFDARSERAHVSTVGVSNVPGKRSRHRTEFLDLVKPEAIWFQLAGIGDATASGTDNTAEEVRQGPRREEGVAPGVPVRREHDPPLDQLPHLLPRDRRVLP